MWSWRLGCHRPEGTVGDQLHIIGRVTLGHESIDTTQIYLDANLMLKAEILAKVHSVDAKPTRFRPNDQLLSFLEGAVR